MNDKKKHPIDEMTEGCRFCAGRFPQVITYSCGWCGRERIYILLIEDEEEEEMVALPVSEVAAISIMEGGDGWR